MKHQQRATGITLALVVLAVLLSSSATNGFLSHHRQLLSSERLYQQKSINELHAATVTEIVAERTTQSSALGGKTDLEAGGAGELIYSLFQTQQCFTSAEGAKAFVETCADSVIFENCYKPAEPWVGKETVQELLFQKVRYGNQFDVVPSFTVDRIRDGRTACGFDWTWTFGDAYGGLRGTMFVELDYQGKISYIREITTNKPREEQDPYMINEIGRYLYQVPDRNLLPLMEPKRQSGFSKAETLHRQLLTDGVVRVNGVLPDALCDACQEEIDNGIDAFPEEATRTKSNGFGPIHEPTLRYDMFLRNEGVYGEALDHMLSAGKPLAELLKSMLETDSSTIRSNVNDNKDGVFHEFASLVSDPGASAQPVHPDMCYHPSPVIYTLFVALQDVDVSMGPTTFLLGTHDDKEEHDTFENGPAASCDGGTFLGKREFRLGLLKKGDVAVMDGRCMHFGGANDNKRRRLFYFTVRMPSPDGTTLPYPERTSIFEDLHLTVEQFR